MNIFGAGSVSHFMLADDPHLQRKQIPKDISLQLVTQRVYYQRIYYKQG